MIENIIEYLIKQGFFLIPLHSTNGSSCTCTKGDKCSSPGKHPLLTHSWKKIATNDIEIIKKWRIQNKQLNFAAVTGRKSTFSNKYLVVIDVDKSQHEIISKLPKTFFYKTGNNGYHFWFWSDIPLKNSVSLLDNKVDVRGNGGYVVIPPSKNYEITEINEIIDLPDFIYEQISKNKETKIPSQKNNKKLKIKNPDLYCQWTEHSIPFIKKQIQSGSLIPYGVRNITCFRVLSSERAKGILEFSNLLRIGKQLRKNMEDPDSFSDEEVEIVARSVMKYPAYNNSFEKVNECYIRWLENNNIKIEKSFIDELVALDELFFSKKLKKTDNIKVGAMSLREIKEAREHYFQINNLKNFSTYRPQLLSKKLESLGFIKSRTAQKNLWAVSLHV